MNPVRLSDLFKRIAAGQKIYPMNTVLKNTAPWWTLGLKTGTGLICMPPSRGP